MLPHLRNAIKRIAKRGSIGDRRYRSGPISLVSYDNALFQAGQIGNVRKILYNLQQLHLTNPNRHFLEIGMHSTIDIFRNYQQ